MANYGIWQGAERATGNMAATGMQLLNYKANREDAAARLGIEQERLGILKEQADRERIAFENTEKKRREQEAIENAFTPASLVAPQLAKFPKLRTQAVEAARAAGFKVEEMPDGEIYAPNKAYAYINNLMKTNTDFQKTSIENTLADLTEQSVSLTKQIAELQQSGKADEKTLGPLLQQQQATKKQIAEIISVRENIMGKLLEQAAKPEAAQRPAVKDYVDAQGNIIPIDVNNPEDRARIVSGGLKPYERPIAPKEQSMTEIMLTDRALKGDTQAQKVLDTIQQRRRELQNIRSNEQQDRSDRQFAVTLRKEFNALPEVKEYNQTVPKINSMKVALAQASKTKNFVAVDQALITLFNKLTDPNSVVRESEYARTAQNIPLLNSIKGKAEKIMRGGAGLTSSERKALVDMATLMQKGYEDIRNRRLREYQGYGVSSGLQSDFLIDSTAGKNSGFDLDAITRELQKRGK